MIFDLWWAVPGVVLLIVGIWGWVMEPSTDPDAGHHHDGHDGHDDEPDGAAAESDAQGELTDGTGETADAEDGGDGDGSDRELVTAESTEEAPVG